MQRLFYDARFEINRENTMRERYGMAIAGSVFGVAIGLSLGASAFAQQQPPTENRGVTIKSTTLMELGPEIEGMGARQLRMRSITLEPGGVFAVHNHKDRPALEIISKGSVTEFRGDAKREVVEGETVRSDRNTTHWWRNDGTTPVVFTVVDVFNPPK